MAQNAIFTAWTRDEVDTRLQLIMGSIHEACVATAETVIVHVDATTRRSRPLPQATAERLRRLVTGSG